MPALTLDFLVAVWWLVLSLTANVPAETGAPHLVPDDQFACVRAWHWPETGDALALCRPLAEEGWPPAQAIVAARLWEAGEDAAALAHAEQAAEAGDRLAQYELGIRYLRGGEVPVDLDRAQTLLEAGARQGCGVCMIEAGNVARQRKDWSKGYYWWLVARDAGLPTTGEADYQQDLNVLADGLMPEERAAVEDRVRRFRFSFGPPSPGSPEVVLAAVQAHLSRSSRASWINRLQEAESNGLVDDMDAQRLVAPSDAPWVEQLSYEFWPHDEHAALLRML